MSVLMDWLRTSLDEIQVGDITPPHEDLKERDVVVGVLESEEVRKLYELMRRTHNVQRQKTQELLNSDELKIAIGAEVLDPLKNDAFTDKLRAAHLELSELDNKRRFVRELFWNCLEAEISEKGRIKRGEIASDSTGIRKDWQIVLIKSPRNDAADLILHSIFAQALD